MALKTMILNPLHLILFIYYFFKLFLSQASCEFNVHTENSASLDLKGCYRASDMTAHLVYISGLH